MEGLGTLTVDTAYGGDSFVIVDAHALGFSIRPDEAKDLAETGMRIVKAANASSASSTLRMPTGTTFPSAVRRARGGGGWGEDRRQCGGIRPGKIDRSPPHRLLARMAVLHAKGQLNVGETFIGRSIIDSRFECRIEGETTLGGRPAILPSIMGAPG